MGLYSFLLGSRKAEHVDHFAAPSGDALLEGTSEPVEAGAEILSDPHEALPLRDLTEAEMQGLLAAPYWNVILRGPDWEKDSQTGNFVGRTPIASYETSVASKCKSRFDVWIVQYEWSRTLVGRVGKPLRSYYLDMKFSSPSQARNSADMDHANLAKAKLEDHLQCRLSDACFYQITQIALATSMQPTSAAA
jgi:hypothetical protein